MTEKEVRRASTGLKTEQERRVASSSRRDDDVGRDPRGRSTPRSDNEVVAVRRKSTLLRPIQTDRRSTLGEFALARASELGFARAGITDIAQPERYGAYREWLEREDHGSMAYMADDFHTRARADMRELLPTARSAVIVALAYDKPGEAPGEAADGARGRVAQYALGEDYHHVIKGKLRALAEALAEQVGHPIQSRACVDSAPLLERELAERAGLGFVAKNTMLISPGLGSYTLLGVLLTDLPLEATRSASLRDCGTCRACLDACPTDAFRAPYQLDARRCISYLTIESSKPVPVELRARIGERIFGCDVCQDVCPYNARAPLRNATAPELKARDSERARPSLPLLASLGSNQRKRYVAGTALRRSNREQLLRNVAVALGNDESGRADVLETLETLREDKSAMVREHAQWAKERRGR